MQEPPTKKYKTDQTKQPELALVTYQGCIAEIKFFFDVSNKIKSHLSEVDSKQSGLLALYKVALMQSICLIGDRLTWLRDKHFYKNAPLYALASEYKISSINHLIKLRNLFSHKFLYFSKELKIKNFQEAFSKKTIECLEEINQCMQTQLRDKKSVLTENTFIGNYQKGKNEQSLFACGNAALEQVALLRMIQNLNAVDESIKEKSMNGCIKNILQIYKDFTENLNDNTENAIAIKADWERFLGSEACSKELFQSVALLQQSKILRDHLAHPNMTAEKATAETLSKQLLDQLDPVQQLFLTLVEFVYNHSGLKEKPGSSICESYFDRVIEPSQGEELPPLPSVFSTQTDNVQSQPPLQQHSLKRQTEIDTKTQKANNPLGLDYDSSSQSGSPKSPRKH